MEKTVYVDDKPVRLMTNGFTPIAYKEQFGKDYFQDMMNMFQGESLLQMMALSQTGEPVDAEKMDMSLLKDFDMTFFNRLFWVFAKSADPQIKSYREYFMDIEHFPVTELAKDLIEMVEANMATKKPSMTANLQAMSRSL